MEKTNKDNERFLNVIMFESCYHVDGGQVEKEEKHDVFQIHFFNKL